MTQQHRESGASRIFVWVATALVVVLVIGAVAFFTNGFTSDFSTFYVEMDGETVMEQKGGFSNLAGSPASRPPQRLDVSGLLGVPPSP